MTPEGSDASPGWRAKVLPSPERAQTLLVVVTLVVTVVLFAAALAINAAYLQ